MGIKARTMGIDLTGVKIDVLKIMKADPRRVGGIELTFHIPDSLKDIDEKTKTILKNTGNTCPVAISLHPDIEQKVDWVGGARRKILRYWISGWQMLRWQILDIGYWILDISRFVISLFIIVIL
jgi:hypothetical protein